MAIFQTQGTSARGQSVESRFDPTGNRRSIDSFESFALMQMGHQHGTEQPK